MSWNIKYSILIFTSTLITYLSGILLDKWSSITDNHLKSKLRKMTVAVSIILNISILVYFKYFNFIVSSIQFLLRPLNLNLSPNNIILPVGISFYTFQALSYTIDCYRGNVRAERHFGKYALFVSFFPQLVAGPIERSSNLLPQFKIAHKFNYDRVRDGFLLTAWGGVKKLVIADRLAILVDTVYATPESFVGGQLLIASVFFTFQIYCDFSSYSDIAVGISKIMGYDLMTNFNKPFLATSVQDFWRRWHISLSTWFRDYLYFPLGGSNVSKLVHYRNIIIVFVISGLWHGASWRYILWGAIHAFYIIIGIQLIPLRNRLVNMFQIERNSFSHKLFKTLITFGLICIAFIFFRANTLNNAIYIINSLFTFSPEILFNGQLYQMGLDRPDFQLAIFLMLFLIAIQCFQTRINIRSFLSKQHLLFRWSIYYIVILSIAALGIFEVNEFLYFQF